MQPAKKSFVWSRLLWIVPALLAASLIIFFVLQRSDLETRAVKRGEIIEAVYGLGTVKNPSTYEVTVGVNNVVERVFVEEGDRVAAGDPLVRMEDKLTFRSPIDGIVTRVSVRKSELAIPSVPLLRIENQKNRYIEVVLEQQGALRVRENQKAQVLFESLRGERFEGIVTSIFSRDSEFLAQINAPSLPETILPGMTADVAIEVARNPSALLIPLSALDSGRVMILRDRRKEKISVKVGAIDAIYAEVKEGDLHEGDLVVVPKKK